MRIRTRFAPSPTGYLHVGGARTALFSWLYARHFGGDFILRIEDTDRERSTQESVDAILQGMDWLGLGYDEGPFYQTQRMDRYREVIQQMLAQGQAYYCYCTKEELDQLREEQQARKEKPRYDGRYRDYKGPPREGVEPVVRFRNPLEGQVVVDDMIHGRVVFDNRELDDLVIARGDGTPTYNFTVVVDDMDMRITHVIRGDDHLNNTPRQMNILAALGASLPRYAHVPMILGSDGKRLSKRHGAVSVMQYAEDGFLPEALLNYLVRLGWSHGDEEVFSLTRMAEFFDGTSINRAAAVFNPDKLLWLNQHYLKELPAEAIAVRLKTQFERKGIDPAAGPDLRDLVEVQRTRARTLVDMAEDSRVFYQEFETYEAADVAKHMTAESLPVLKHLHAVLSALPGWNAEPLHECVKAAAETLGLKLGKVAQPLRVAVCGRASSPPIDATLVLLGRERALRRIERAVDMLERR